MVPKQRQCQCIQDVRARAFLFPGVGIGEFAAENHSADPCEDTLIAAERHGQ